MAKFMALYLVPPAVIADWQTTDPEIRKPAEEKMRAAWTEWTATHAKAIGETNVGGKTKRVDASGTADTKNAIMLYCIVDAESHEAAARMFEGHPHLTIPQSSIEIMEVRPMQGM